MKMIKHTFTLLLVLGATTCLAQGKTLVAWLNPGTTITQVRNIQRESVNEVRRYARFYSHYNAMQANLHIARHGYSRVQFKTLLEWAEGPAIELSSKEIIFRKEVLAHRLPELMLAHPSTPLYAACIKVQFDGAPAELISQAFVRLMPKQPGPFWDAICAVGIQDSEVAYKNVKKYEVVSGLVYLLDKQERYALIEALLKTRTSKSKKLARWIKCLPLQS